MATLFGIDGGLLKSILSKALATGEATFHTSNPHDVLKKSAKYHDYSGMCAWRGKSPLYIRVDAENKFAEFKTFGGSFTTSARVSADGIRIDASGEMILPAKAAGLLAHAVKGENFYEFSIGKGSCKITEGDGAAFSFQVVSDKKLRQDFAAEYPEIDGIKIDGSEFIRLVKKTAYIGAAKAGAGMLFSQPEFQHVNIKSEYGELSFTGAERHRIATATAFHNNVESFSCNIPSAALNFIAKITGREITLAISKGTAHFASGFWRVDIRLADIQFPNVSNALNSFDLRISANTYRQCLIGCLKLCAIAVDVDKRVKFVFSKDCLTITAGTPYANVRQYLPVDTLSGLRDNETAEIEMNLNNLLDAVSSFSSETVKLGVSEQGMAIFENTGDASTVIAAMRNDAGGSSVKLPPVSESVEETTIDITAAPVEETPAIEEIQPAVEEKLSQIGTAIRDAIKERYGKDWADKHIMVATVA